MKQAIILNLLIMAVVATATASQDYIYTDNSGGTGSIRLESDGVAIWKPSRKHFKFEEPSQYEVTFVRFMLASLLGSVDAFATTPFGMTIIRGEDFLRVLKNYNEDFFSYQFDERSEECDPSVHSAFVRYTDTINWKIYGYCLERID